MVPLTRELDPTAGPLDFFGAEVRRWRTAAGLSQEQLGQKVGYSGAQVGKVETGERAPAVMTDGVAPRFAAFSSGVDLGDPVDRAIMRTRSAVFASHGLLPQPCRADAHPR